MSEVILNWHYFHISAVFLQFMFNPNFIFQLWDADAQSCVAKSCADGYTAINLRYTGCSLRLCLNGNLKLKEHHATGNEVWVMTGNFFYILYFYIMTGHFFYIL